MDFNQLRYFRVVAQTLNFTHAADFLYMSQTTLSYQISSLEKEVGVKLFNRGRNGVELTPAGETLYKLIPNIMDQLDDALRATQEAARGGNGILRIGFLGAHEQHFLPELVSQFSENYPSIDVLLKQGTPDGLISLLRRDLLDLIFVLSRDPIAYEGIVIDMFENLPLFAVMRKDNELAKQESLTRKDLIDQKLCFMNEESSSCMHKNFVRSFEGYGKKAKIVDTTSTMEYLMMIIEAKGYVTVCPKCLAVNHPFLVTVPMSDEDEYVMHGVAWREDSSNPAIPIFVDMGKELLERRTSENRQFPF